MAHTTRQELHALAPPVGLRPMGPTPTPAPGRRREPELMLHARLITCSGVRLSLVRHLEADSMRPCVGPRAFYHRASVLIEVRLEPPTVGYLPSEEGPGAYTDDPRWPTQCATCKMAFPVYTHCYVEHRRHFDTASGRPEAGDLFWGTWREPAHLLGVLPNGDIWDLDHEDGSGHKVWARAGDPPDVTVTPSVRAPGYAGGLTAGIWQPDTEGRRYPRAQIAKGYA